MTSRSAILAPGGNSSVDVPVLMFARLAVQRRGGRAHPIVWDLAASRDFTAQRQRVIAQVESAVNELTAGTGADPYWDGRTARSLTADVVEIDGADHAMVVPGRLMESAAALGEVITAVEDFLDHVIWPQPSNRGRIM
jgi:hypothetical protein